MLLLLHIQHGPIFEGPFDHIGLVGSAFDMLAFVELTPELVEVLKLDQVPDIGERSGDDGGFSDGSGGGDTSGHDGC